MLKRLHGGNKNGAAEMARKWLIYLTKEFRKAELFEQSRSTNW